MRIGRGLVGVALLASLSACQSGADREPSPSATTPPSPTSTSTTEALPRLGELPEGAPPDVPYVDGAEYVAADGARHRVPVDHGVTGVVPWAGGLLVADASYFEGTNGLALVRDGRPVADWPGATSCSSGQPALGAHGQVAWATFACPESGIPAPTLLHRATADGEELTQELPVRPNRTALVSVAGFLGSDLVYNAGWTDGAWLTDLRSAPRMVPGVEGVVDVDSAHRRLIGQNGDAARLVVRTDGRVVWRADRGTDLVSFSPSGDRVLARAGRRYVVLGGSDGTPVAVLRQTPASWREPVWENDRSLLFEARGQGKAAIVRLRIGGRLERATTIRASTPQHPAYVLLGVSP